MSLTAAINIGRTALNASQLGIQVAGNNMANASTPGYSRQVLSLSPLFANKNVPQVSIGAGVQVAGIQRQVDQGLLNRIWSTSGDQAGAQAILDIYSQVEASLNELGDSDLSSELSGFFRAWSERANNTKSAAAVVQQGDKLASFLRRVRNDLTRQNDQIEAQLAGQVSQANSILESISQLNQAISDAEVGGQPANTLRDQRDQFVTQLSELVPVTVIDRGREGYDVLVSSVPVVLGAQSRGLELGTQTDASGKQQVFLSTKSDKARLPVDKGTIGGLLASQGVVIENVVGKLDTLAGQLIFEVNKLHATGTNGRGYSTMLSTQGVATADRARALNDPLNTSIQTLPNRPGNGGILVRVQHSSGSVTETRIDIDLDGITSAGAAGTTNDTTAQDVVNALDAIAGIRASFDAEGKLKIDADDGFTFSFAEDTSNTLASLGVNAYFTGKNANDIGLRTDLKNDPTLLASGRFQRNPTTNNWELVDNGTALALATLQNQGIASLSGRSVADFWRDTVQEIAAKTSEAKASSDSAGVVRDSLESQRQAMAGVSLDEEAINLLSFQRMYQAAARVVSVADEMIQTLLNTI
jgi:flagellar hook-associated protein 1